MPDFTVSALSTLMTREEREPANFLEPGGQL